MTWGVNIMTRKKTIKTLRKKKKTEKIHRFTQKQNLGRNRLTAKEFRLLQRMSHSAKALRNVGLYTIKQSYIKTGEFPTVKEIDAAMKADVNYWCVQSHSVQAIRRTLGKEVKSFLKALEKWEQNSEYFTGRPKFPKYSDSNDKRVIEIYQVPKVDTDGYWQVPMNTTFRKRFGSIKIRMPKNLLHERITYIEIVPKQKGRFFEVHYTYEVQVAQMKKQPTITKYALAIDLGVDNLMSSATNDGEAFLIDGKKLKSINQYFNKKMSKQRQKNIENNISKRVVTNQQANLWMKRERQINGYFSQAIGLLFKKVKELNVDTIIVGYNVGWKTGVSMGKKNNQQFVQIPFAKLISAIENKCLKEGIRFIKQEESYTSQACFLNRDTMPIWGEENLETCRFSGQRITRGLYQSKTGQCIHADINAALNILRKSAVIEIAEQLSVKTPTKLFVQKRKAIASRIA